MRYPEMLGFHCMFSCPWFSSCFTTYGWRAESDINSPGFDHLGCWFICQQLGSYCTCPLLALSRSSKVHCSPPVIHLAHSYYRGWEWRDYFILARWACIKQGEGKDIISSRWTPAKFEFVKEKLLSLFPALCGICIQLSLGQGRFF
jgi:hypothetical protein